MADRRGPNKALQLLMQLVPKIVLDRVRELSLQEEREDYYKRYLARHIIFILTSCFGAMLVSAIILRTFAHVMPADGAWVKYMFVPGLLAWLVSVLYYMHRLLEMMRLAALAKQMQETGDVPSRVRE